MLRKIMVAVAVLVVLVALLSMCDRSAGCEGAGSQDTNGITLMSMTDAKNGGSTGGSTRRKDTEKKEKKEKPSSTKSVKPGTGVAGAAVGRLPHDDDCDED